jgi:copper(I)-binding protein
VSARLRALWLSFISLAVAAGASPGVAFAGPDAGAGSTALLEVRDPWVRASLNPRNTAAYMTLVNPTDQEIVIVSASSPAARVVEMHEMAMEAGTMRMRRVERIAVPAHGTARLAPGSLHLMLIDLPRPVAAGEQVAITLRLVDGREVRIEAPVKSALTR